jgi:hypothetical protein
MLAVVWILVFLFSLVTNAHTFEHVHLNVTLKGLYHFYNMRTRLGILPLIVSLLREGGAQDDQLQ